MKCSWILTLKKSLGKNKDNVTEYTEIQQVFESELQLDDVLYAIKNLSASGVHDVAYDLGLSIRLNEAFKKVRKKGNDFREWLEQNKDKVEQPKERLDNDIEPTEFKSPLIGVNRFLASIRKLDGNPLFPIFKEDNYWAEKKADWAEGKFEDEELEEVREIVKDPTLYKLTDTESFELVRKAYTLKWEAQGRFGNSLHEVMRLFWGGDRGKLKGQSNETIVKYIVDHFQKLKEENEEAFVDKYGTLTESHIALCVTYAKNLKKDIELRFGETLVYMPEVALDTELPEAFLTNGDNKLMGVIDLLVIDSQGNAHVIDYKTSPKPYEKYNSAKVRTFEYLMATYRRLLERAGLNLTLHSGVYVAPLELLGFRKTDQETWTFDDIVPYTENGFGETSNGEKSVTYLKDLTTEIFRDDNIGSYVDLLLPLPQVDDIEPKETLSYVDTWMKKWFPRYYYGTNISDDEVMDYIKRNKIDLPTKEGYCQLELFYPLEIIKVPQAEWRSLIPKVREKIAGEKGARIRWTKSIKREIMNAINSELTHVSFAGINGKRAGEVDNDWLTHTLEKYVNGNWRILGMDENQDSKRDIESYEMLENMGIIMFKNKITGQIDVVKITNEDVDKPMPLHGRKNITSAFLPDIAEDSKDKTLILESNQGNVELMETMLALNANPELFDNGNGILGQIVVVNPLDYKGKWASNKELLYNFNALASLSKMDLNNFSKNNKLNTSRIKLRTTYDLVRDHLYELLYRVKSGNVDRKWNGFKSFVNDLNSAIDDPVRARAVLMALNDRLEDPKDGFTNLSKVNTTPYSAEQASPEIKLQLEIITAIAEIDGYDLRLQNQNDEKMWEGLAKLIRKGHSGTYLDNQGFLSNPSLNRCATATTIAYLNTREAVLAVKSKLKELVEAVKKEEHFGYFTERTFGNQSKIYLQFITKTKGDLMFKHPDEFTGAKRALLEFVLETINKNRFGLTGYSGQALKDRLAEISYEQPFEYYSVPLTLASTSAKAANVGGIGGLFAALKEKLKAFNPREAVNEYKKKVEGYFSPDHEEAYEKIRNGEMWKMVNQFDGGERYRDRVIADNGGVDAFETNLETLTLKHVFAYELERNVNEILPMIRATMMNVANQSLILNKNYGDTLQYISDYIRNKVFNLSLVDEKGKSAKIIWGKLQAGASKLALAFSPALLYLHLDGIWKDISLMIRKPDGETSFTITNMKDAYFFAYKDLMHYGNGNSITELINEYYGINDMDMNSYIDKIKSDLSGIYNFDSLMFRMASRPDFYNRMTIFMAQMRGDGCWDAHVKEGTKLVYKWELDKRFNLFAKYKNNPPASLSESELAEYNKQRALYIATAEQLVRERTKNADLETYGEYFTLDLNNPMPLPKAYTTQLAEGMKALGDMIYGYYSHEKKSLWQSTTIGSLFMQMNTYWSSKKNQFLAPGGIRYMGQMKHYEEVKRDDNGNVITDAQGNAVTEKYYEVVGEDGQMLKDENGNNIIISESEIKEGMKVIPFMQWQGQFHEGIFVTLFQQFATFVNPTGELKFEGSIKDRFRAVHELFWNNPDENLRRAYRSNIKQFWYDLLMWLLIGMIVGPALSNAASDYKKEEGNDSLKDAAINTSLALGATLVTNSGADFNAIKSIGGLGLSWTPFSILTYSRLIENVVNVVGGDKSVYTAMINTAAATRSTKPLWEYVGEETGWSISRNAAAAAEL